MDNTWDIVKTVLIGTCVATFLFNTSRVVHALNLCKECLSLLNNKALKNQKQVVQLASAWIYLSMFKTYCLLNDHTSGIECGRKLLHFLRGCGKKTQEGQVTSKLAELYYLQNKCKEAKGLYEKTLSIMIEIGDKRGEAACYGNLGTVYQTLGEYGKAETYQKNALVITKEIGDKQGEAACYGNLGAVYQTLGEYGKAETYQKNALVIRKEIGDKQGEAASYGNLGAVYQTLGEYGKAETYQKNAIVITKEIGDKRGEATCYGNLGRVYQSVGEYGKAETYQKKALVITKEIGCKEGEAACYGNLGSVYLTLGEYGKAETYLKNALVIRKEIGDKQGEAVCYGDLGIVYQSLGEYGKAETYQNNALVIKKEIGDKKGEATCYVNLGALYESLGEYRKAETHHKDALVITKEIGDIQGEAACYGRLGSVCQSLGEYGKAETYQNNALVIRKEIGDKQGEATCYGNLGIVYQSLGEYGKAETYLENALVILKEIGVKEGEALSYRNLGSLFRSLGKYARAKEYDEKALALSREIGYIDGEAISHLNLAWDFILEEKVSLKDDVFSNLLASINKCEKIRSFLGCNDQFKISLLEMHSTSYELLSALHCGLGNSKDALCVLELARGRALVDLISGQYSEQNQTSVNPLSWPDIERIVKKEIDCICLYISYFGQDMFLWVLKGNKPTLFRKVNVNECFVNKGLERNVQDVFSEQTFRRFNILRHDQEHYEDRSLFFSKARDSTHEILEEGNSAAFRPVEAEEEEDLQPVPTIAECYQMIIAPVVEFLDETELVIVPDRALYKVPFAALKDESGRYLSQTYRIRIVPSLSTLGLIQDSPADYHSQTGALIAGDPEVGEVLYKGHIENLCRLPSARKEAQMIGELLGAEPLLGEQATKQAVLKRIPSVSLIHFAAHSHAERGEIALTPQDPTNVVACEKDYLLTMDDISQVQLRAKLVVLSCCHSAQGKVRAEGVVGIARAFLGSGARSVLVALWAIPDKATEQLMSHFYKHLVRGESASESLHQAMKWMRSNGYPDKGDWAAFMLIGDNVKFDFGK